MHPDLTLLIRLQGIDERIKELEREVSALPKHIAEIEKALDQHLRKLEADRAELTANQKARKKQEGDIQVAEQKASKLRDQMLSAKTNEQYRAFQNEIEFCQLEVRKAEDRILELMAESEALERNVRAAEAALQQEKEQVEQEKRTARERTAADEAQLAALRSERAAAAGKVTPAVGNSYDKIRRKRGYALAEATDGRCSACHMTIRPQYFQDLRTSDHVMVCESCGRILFYNPPVVVEEDGPAAGTQPSPLQAEP